MLSATARSTVRRITKLFDEMEERQKHMLIETDSEASREYRMTELVKEQDEDKG